MHKQNLRVKRKLGHNGQKKTLTMELQKAKLCANWRYNEQGVWTHTEKKYRCSIYHHERIEDSFFINAGVVVDGKKYQTTLKIQNDEHEGQEALLLKIERGLDQLIDEQL